MKFFYFLFLSTIIFLKISFATGIDSLLDELAKKDDLSVYTKKETAGFIKIFTREDLDRMKIRSFDELIDKIPFLKNKTDNLGLNDPYYSAYQASNPSRIRLFINEREILTPFMGSGLRLFGQVDISYIDHIEVYHGIPSYEVAIEPSIVVIKAYTKVGKRENTTTFGTAIGEHNTYDAYAYKSEKLDDYSYFAYLNHRNLERDKVENLGSELSRDKKTTHAYAQLSNETSNFEIQAMSGKIDSFAGTSWSMTPKDAYTDFMYLSSAYTYKTLDKSLKVNLNYTYLTYDDYESANSPLGVTGTYPFYVPYYTYETDIKEHLLDFKITKLYTFSDTSLLIGLGNRFKKFSFDSYKLDNVEYALGSEYNTEDIVSAFTEIKHSVNDNNQIILSLNVQKYFENANVNDEVLYSARLGHIYTKDNYTQKSFLLYGKFHPSNIVLFKNDQLSSGLNILDSETACSLGTQALFRYDNFEYSLHLARSTYEDGIVYDLTSYRNFREKFIFNSISFDGTYSFNSTDKIGFTAWTLINDYGKKSSDRYQNEYGGSLSLYKKIFSFDTYNSLTYVNGKNDNPDGWNYNATITYPYSKQLSIFLKGKNLLNKALTSDYSSINPFTTQITKLDNIANVDRIVWFGLEYKF